MKKRNQLLLLSLILLLGLTACGKIKKPEDELSNALEGEPFTTSSPAPQNPTGDSAGASPTDSAEPSQEITPTEGPQITYITYTAMDPTVLYVVSPCPSYTDFNTAKGEYAEQKTYWEGTELTVTGKGEFDGKNWYRIEEASNILLVNAECLSDTKPAQNPDLDKTEDWGVGGYGDQIQPGGNASAATLAKYDAYYVGSPKEKIIYLTIDCGYENGNTESIIETLVKHNAPATFFVVSHYLNSAPELVQKMLDNGFTVGSHTYSHPDMSQISDMESFRKEMERLEDLYRDVTGQEITKFYRPPQGKYNLHNLQMAKDLGYSTFFWSVAHMDWVQDNQPTHDQAINTLTKRIHPGAIVLLHCVSKTNAEVLDELLTKWEGMGYTYGKLEDLTQ